MKVLILGHTGMLGNTVWDYLTRKTDFIVSKIDGRCGLCYQLHRCYTTEDR